MTESSATRGRQPATGPRPPSGKRGGRGRAGDFLLLIALPLLVTTLALTVGSAFLLQGIARSVNAQEDQRTWQAVQSAVGALEDRLAGIAADNAHWDDAVRETYGRLNSAWTDAMWGVGSGDVNYDTVFLLGPDGHPLIAYQKGKPLTGAAPDYLGDALPRLQRFAETQASSFATLSSIANTAEGLAIITAAPVLPTSPALATAQPVPNLLVLIRHITPQDTERLGREYIVDGLTLAPATAQAEGPHVIRDHWEQPVAVASWTPRNPGALAKNSYRKWVLGGILGLLGTMLPLASIYFRRLTELEESQARALHAARHDALTGLLTRNALISDLEEELKAAPEHGLALMLVDVDDIRGINDSFGLHAGDAVIRLVTQRLADTLGGEVQLARFGGNSFAAAFHGPAGLARAEDAAPRVIAALAGPVKAAHGQARLTVNIGIAAGDGAQAAPATLAREADLALHHATLAGPNTWRRFQRLADFAAQ